MLTRDLMLRDVITANKNFTVKEGIDLLFKRHIGCIVILDDNKKCEGIFTERDALRIISQEVPLNATMEKIMTKNPFTVNEDSTFEEAKKIIKSYKIRHLPVVDADGKLVGMISVRHILNELCDL